MSAQLLPLPIDPTRRYTVEEYFALANASPTIVLPIVPDCS